MTAKGKIGRLPFAVRQELCRRKREGTPDVDLLAWLNGDPDVAAALKGKKFGGKAHRSEISHANLSEYFRPGGPYEEWAKDQAQVERVQKMAEFTMRLAEISGGSVNRGAAAIAAGKIMTLLEKADDEDVNKLASVAAQLCDAEAKATRAQTDGERLAVQRQTVDLDRRKFHYTVARDALRLFEDQQARAIAEGKGSREEKIQALLAHMEKMEKEEE